MNVEDTVRRQLDAFNRHDAEAFAACYSDHATIADPQFQDPVAGSAAIARDVADWFGSFPDVQASLTRTVVHGAQYAAEWSMHGTHKGPLVTPDGHVPPTGKAIRVTVVTIGRTDGGGRIVEERRAYDLAGIMNQLGLMQ